MIPSRKLAAMFFCVFLLGAIAGGLIVYNFAGKHFSAFLNHTGDPVALAERIDQRLTDKYNLDPEQRARISPLTREMAKNLYKVRRKFAEDFLSTVDASHAKICEQMTTEQRTAYIKDMAEKKRVASAMLMPATNLAFPAQQ